jgi:hypothetical protein
MKREYIKRVMEDVFSESPSADYDGVKPEKTLKNILFEILGTEKPTAMDLISYKMDDFYAIVAEVVGNEVSEDLEQSFDFAEYANVAWGDERTFELDSPELFHAGVIAKGNGDIAIQNITNGFIDIATDAIAIKFAVPFMRWVSGRIDFDKLKRKVVSSYVKKVRTLVYKAFFETASYNSDSNYNVADTAGLDAGNLNALADKVGAANNSDVLIMATKPFIRSYAGNNTLSDIALEEIRMTGAVRMTDGNVLMAVDNVLDADDAFVLDDATAIIMPVNSGKIVKIVEEGETLIKEQVNMNGNMSKEYMFYKHLGVGVAAALKYGRYTFTG